MNRTEPNRAVPCSGKAPLDRFNTGSMAESRCGYGNAHHISLPPNLHPVVRPLVSLDRSAPATGRQTCRGLHRCLKHTLGGHVQQACSVEGLDGPPTVLAHQLPRVAGSTPGLEPSQEKLTRQARTGSHGQHCDRCVHQPTRWSTLPLHVATRPPPPPLESEASEVTSCYSHSGNWTADELSRAALPGDKHCARSGRMRSRSCSWHPTGPLGPGSGS